MSFSAIVESEESPDLTKASAFIEGILRRFAPQNDFGFQFIRSD
jgi:hypothetical protein